MKNDTDTAALSLLSNEAGYDPMEDRLRETIRAPVEALFEEEPEASWGRCRHDRGTGRPTGYRHGDQDTHRQKGHGYFRSGGHWHAPALSAECFAIACHVWTPP